MTDENGNPMPRKAWMKDEAIKFAFRQFLTIVITGFVALTAALVWEPARDWLVGMGTMPREIQKQGERIEAVETTVRRLTQPRKVFEVSRVSTRPVAGFCEEGEPCRIKLRIRRLEPAKECQIVPGSVEWGFVNPRSEIFAHAERVDPPAGRNIGLTWEDTFVTVITPTGLQPDANFTFIARYTHCPGWIEGEPPLEYQNEPIPFAIKQVE